MSASQEQKSLGLWDFIMAVQANTHGFPQKHMYDHLQITFKKYNVHSTFGYDSSPVLFEDRFRLNVFGKSII